MLSKTSRAKFKTPAFFPVTRFQSLIHRSPLLTLTISFMLGCTAKSLTPAGTIPCGAVSPLGWPKAFGRGDLTVEIVVRSLVREMAIELSSEEDSSFDRVGK